MRTKRESMRVAVNGYGVIGKRVADAIVAQEDMELTGIADIETGWRMKTAQSKGFKIFSASPDRADAMRKSGLDFSGTLEELIADSDVVVDCTPKGVAARNVEGYREHGVKFIVQGGEKHEVTGHSFVAEVTYDSAIDRDATRVVSCNTTSIVRALTALKRAGLLKRARGTLMRRATDPWESHLGGIMNTIVPEPDIPSHQGPDAQTVDPDLDVMTMAVKVPMTLAHLHYWSVQLARTATRKEVIDAFRNASRIALVHISDGLSAVNSIKEAMADIGRPRDDLYEVALWEDLITVQGDELFYAYMVDNQAIVIPETIDAIRALTGAERNARASIDTTNRSLGIRQGF